MTWARVVFVSKNGAWAVVHQEDEGEWSIFELLGDEGEIQTGDQIKGNWGSDGGETVFPQGLGRSIDIYIQGRFASSKVALEKAREWSGDLRS
jgi:hypothetical protein